MLKRSLPLARSILAAAAIAAASRAMGQNVSFSTVAANGYGAGDINSCAIALNNITTSGNFQFIAYYDSSRRIIIGRRTLGSNTWQTFNSGISISATDITDDHDVIAIAVDSGGFMHMSWDMHNVSLDYAISNTSVTTPTLSGIPFTTETAANAPTLFANSGATTNEVTYPQFYTIPNSSNLLFTYRNGGAGGGSGNGNQYFDIYNPTTKTWTNNFVINGETTNVNAYLNSMAYTSSGNLLMSWTWRATPNWQTNSNIMFAQSPDNGTTWFKQGGATQYTLPIIQSGSPASSVAQVVKAIPQNSSFINQTSMTVDGNDNPIIATYFAPGWNTTTNSGNPNRQYMLVYYDGTQWRTSQVSSRTSDAAIDTSGNDVRDLGRPIVLTDSQGRVLVVTRSEDTALGSYANSATVGNGVVVYYNTVASLDSANPVPWQSVTLDSTNLGAWEPTYDSALWKSQNKLDLFFEPVGLNGETTGTIKVLDWNEPAYFAGVTYWNNAGGGNWDTPGNWTGVVPGAVGGVANFGGASGAALAVDASIAISGTKTVGAINFDNPSHKFIIVQGDSSGAISLDNGSAASSITVVSGSHEIAVPISLSSNGVNISVNGAMLTISSSFSGSGPVNVSGAGTLVLSHASTMSGAVTINPGAQGPGVVRAAASSALGTGAVTIGPAGNSTTARLELTGNISLPNGISLPGRNSGTVAIENISGDNTLAGKITLNVGGGLYAVQSDSGTLTLSGATAITSAATGARTLTLGGAGNGVVSGAIVNGSAVIALMKAGSGTWTLSGANTNTGNTTVAAGTLIAPQSLLANSPAMTINGGELVLNYTGATITEAVRTELVSGYNAGAWSGAGISSATAAADATDRAALGYADAADVGITSAGGMPIGSSEVIVKYTYYGDASLDGKVDLGNDFNLFLIGYLTPGSASWDFGDFNYDGDVDSTDFGIFVDGYAAQGGSLGELDGVITGSPMLSIAQKASLLATVPEPAIGAAFALAGLIGVSRCRRRYRN